MSGREGMMKEMSHTGPNQDPHTPFGPKQDLPYPYMGSGNPLKLAFRVELGLRSIFLYGVERDGIAIQLSMDMEEIPDDGGFLENRYPNTSWWRSEFAEKLGSVSLDGKQEIMRNRELTEREYDRLSSQIASQIFWNTGTLSEPIPNGFYSVVPEKRLKECFEDIPTLDDLHALELEGLGADVILVDAKKDKKLSMLKQLIVTQLKSCSNDKKDSWIGKKVEVKSVGICDFSVVCLPIQVADVYKRPNSELSHAKASLEEASQISENKGVQLLGQIKHSSSRPRAILFKLLADTVGLESQLVVGLPAEAASECAESYKHMSILVVLNSVELFVDLIRFPGRLIPRTTKSIYLTHIAAGESDSAENDSCDSPLEPNSPLYEFSERNDTDSSEKDDILQYQRKLRYFLAHTESHDLTFESSSQSEPNTATIWRRGRRKVITEPRTASSSPEHPSFRAHVRSMLSGDNKTSRGYSDDVSTSRYFSHSCLVTSNLHPLVHSLRLKVIKEVNGAYIDVLNLNRHLAIDSKRFPLPLEFMEFELKMVLCLVILFPMCNDPKLLRLPAPIE
ncbi:hypothetical protein CQW23_23340 [Capsicum baccatum]|uniref:EDR1/CTR1/ARMC3-like peptidase-like domain-containing protein n=1 Tax=Capsicum baccatum TaxID=33114 RepID=A0A2G2VRP1_CAPBA|nr:hypothetical protein CQW23_23340 [Capsicum baccatum]